MNGLWLLAPFLLVRFGPLLSREAAARAARFAPMEGGERAAYWVYQLSTGALFLCLPFLRVGPAPALPFWAGLACYLSGLALCAASIAAFSAPSDGGCAPAGSTASPAIPCMCPTFCALREWPF